MTMISYISRILCLHISLVFIAELCADTVTTRTGANFQGRIELKPNGLLKVGVKEVSLGDLLRAEFEAETKEQKPSPDAQSDELKRLTLGLWAAQQSGALTWDGSFIARKVVAMDDTKVSFENLPKELFLSTVNTSAVFFGPISLEHAYRLKGKRQGILLASGHFVEGNLKSVAGGTVVLESVLLGRKSYTVGAEALVLWLQTPKPTATRFTLRTKDGSLLLAKEPTLQDGVVILNRAPFQNYHIARDDLIEIRNGNATDVLNVAWAKIDNATPDKKATLLAGVGNVGRMLELREQMQTTEVKLQEAMNFLSKAEKAKAEGSANRQRVLQEWKQLQNEWKQKNREYWNAHSNNIRMASKVRTQRSAVDRAKRTLNNSQRTLDRYNQKLEKFENDVLKGNIKVKDKKDERRKRESYLRPIRRAEKSMQKAHQQLAEAQRDDKKIQAEVKPLPLEEKVAKETLDQAKKESDQAMLNYRKTIVDYQAASRQASIARSKASELQQQKDQTVQELEKLRLKQPALEPRK